MAIYRIVTPLTRGIFKDKDWRNIRSIWKALEAEGVNVSINDAKYDHDGIDGTPSAKRWFFTAECQGFTFQGTLIACFCGPISDPTDRYDICFII